MERTAIVGSPRSTRVMKLLEEVEWRLALAFFGKALVERTKIDHHSLMSSAADLFHLVARRHLEFNSFSLDLDYFGFGTNIMTCGRSGKMPYIYRRADRALTTSRNGLIALRAAFSMIRIITGVASTCGNMASLN